MRKMCAVLDSIWLHSTKIKSMFSTDTFWYLYTILNSYPRCFRCSIWVFHLFPKFDLIWVGKIGQNLISLERILYEMSRLENWSWNTDEKKHWFREQELLLFTSYVWSPEKIGFEESSVEKHNFKIVSACWCGSEVTIQLEKSSISPILLSHTHMTYE